MTTATAAAMENVTRFPLAWPNGWKRTSRPREARYGVSLEVACNDLLAELDRMGARQVVLSTNLPARRDGLPRCSLPEPADRAVAVYWLAQGGTPMVMACDTWTTVRANIRAVGLAVAALRMIERTGASQLLERAYTGFAALPAPANTQSSRPWLNVLFGENAPLAGMGRLTRQDIELAYKRMVRIAHPDLGGSHEQMVQVNRAYQDALQDLG